MKKVLTSLSIASAFLLAFAVSSFAQTAMNEDYTKKGPQIGGQIQWLGQLEVVGLSGVNTITPEGNNNPRIAMFLREARLRFYGMIDEGLLSGATYKISFFGAGEGNSIQDAYADIPIFGEGLRLRIGQYMQAFSREAMSDTSTQMFVRHSINTTTFGYGRDTALSLYGNLGGLLYHLSIGMGTDVNVAEKFFPMAVGFQPVILRIGYSSLEKNIFDIQEFNPANKKNGWAVMLNAYYYRDSIGGHTTSMSRKNATATGTFFEWTNNSLVYNKLFNPIMPGAVGSQSTSNPVGANNPQNTANVFQAGLDAAFQQDLGGGILLNAAAEWNVAYSQGTLQAEYMMLMGGTVRAGVYFGDAVPLLVGLRYSILLPDAKMGSYTSAARTSFVGVGLMPIHEIGLALNVYLAKNVTVRMDMQLWVDTLAMHADTGQYNLMQIPSSMTSSLKATDAQGSLFRVTNYDARLLFQLAF